MYLGGGWVRGQVSAGILGGKGQWEKRVGGGRGGWGGGWGGGAGRKMRVRRPHVKKWRAIARAENGKGRGTGDMGGASLHPRSPVLNQPSKKLSALASSFFSYPRMTGWPLTMICPTCSAPCGSWFPAPSWIWHWGPIIWPEVPGRLRVYPTGGDEMGMHSVMP
jgi:hypothetical protein